MSQTRSEDPPLKARLSLFALGLGLMFGPPGLWYLIFIASGSRSHRGGRDDGLYLLGAVLLLLALGIPIIGWRVIRVATGPFASESDLYADPDAPKFADSSLICMAVGLGGGSAVIVDHEAETIHFRLCHFPVEPSQAAKAPKWHSCTLQDIVRTTHTYQTHQGRTTSTSFEIRTRDGKAIVAPSMTNYAEMCRCLEKVCPTPGDSAQACEPDGDTTPERESVRRTEDDTALTELLTSMSATPSARTRGSLPTPPYGASFRETKSGWCLTAPFTSIGTAIASGLLIAICSYWAFQGLTSGMLSTIHGPEFLTIVFFVLLPLCLGAAFGWFLARSLWGQLRISSDGKQLTVFQGVGLLGSTQVFDASRTSRIIETIVSRGKYSDTVIQLTGTTQIHFGELLSGEHRNYVRLALCQLLLEPKRGPVQTTGAS